jgi:DNA-binding Lrp family transcriptional regulator
VVTAIVLMSIERGQVNEVASRLVDMQGVSEVYSVAGRYDLVAMLRVRSNEDLANLVTAHMQKMDGIRATETLIAFQAYSRHDLEAIFSIGFERT